MCTGIGAHGHGLLGVNLVPELMLVSTTIGLIVCLHTCVSMRH